MSLNYGFYNSVDGDRVYEAGDFASIFDGIITDGVFATIGNAMMTRPGTGLQVIVGNGKAWFDHTWNTLDVDTQLAIGTAHGNYPRIDAVVLEVDAENRANSVKVIAGTAASTPQRPALEDYQHPLAYVIVPKNATSISAANIDIMVGTSACPFVTGILETVDIDELLSKWNQIFADDRSDQAAEFHAWFDHLVDELSEHQAANLQRQIDEARGEMAVMDTFKVGDLLNTKRSDPGDNWLLCNGRTYPGGVYPELEQILPIQRVKEAGGFVEVGSSSDQIVSRDVDNACFVSRANSRRLMAYYTDPETLESSYVVVGLPNTGLSSGPAPFVAYNKQTERFAVPLYTYGVSVDGLVFYETADDIRKTQYPAWSKCTVSYTSLPLASSLKDFIWWNGHYWAIVTRSSYSDIYMCSSLTSDDWVLVHTITYGGFVAFSIVDNHLVIGGTTEVVIGEYDSRRTPWIEYRDDVYGEFIHVDGPTIEGGLFDLFRGNNSVYLKKIANRYFMISQSGGSIYASSIDGPYTLTPIYAHESYPGRGAYWCESDTYVYAIFGLLVRATPKDSSGNIDINAAEWTTILSFNTSVYSAFCAADMRLLIVNMDPYIRAYHINVIQVPAISSSDQYYTFIKAASTLDPTPVETLPLVYVDSFDPDTGTLNLVSNSEES